MSENSPQKLKRDKDLLRKSQHFANGFSAFPKRLYFIRWLFCRFSEICAVSETFFVEKIESRDDDDDRER
jgi:hypothetical protein